MFMDGTRGLSFMVTHPLMRDVVLISDEGTKMNRTRPNKLTEN
jgi:hypothetical protein